MKSTITTVSPQTASVPDYKYKYNYKYTYGNYTPDKKEGNEQNKKRSQNVYCTYVSRKHACTLRCSDPCNCN